METLGLPATGRVVPQQGRERLQAVWPQAAPQLARLVAALCLGEAQADDVLQEVYIAAWEKCPPLENDDQLRRWLYRVTINRCHLEMRKWRRWKQLIPRLWHRTKTPEESGDGWSEPQKHVREALRKLAPNERAALVLRYYADFDSAEIGRILGLPAATVRSHLRRGRLALANKLQALGYGDKP